STPPSTPRFVVTPEMRDGLWRVMRERGFDFDRAIYDDASSIISLLVAREVTRYVFGAADEARRSIEDDEVTRAARALVGGATSQREVLERAAQRQTLGK